jgi:hypothetical protein
MTAFSANPLIYVFSALAIGGALAYFAYGAIDRVGLATYAAEGTVSGKQYNPPGTSHYTNIVAGRAWTQSQETPETYVLTLSVDGETALALVSKEAFEAARVNDRLRLLLRRTRISGRLEVVEVSR